MSERPADAEVGDLSDWQVRIGRALLVLSIALSVGCGVLWVLGPSSPLALGLTTAGNFGVLVIASQAAKQRRRAGYRW